MAEVQDTIKLAYQVAHLVKEGWVLRRDGRWVHEHRNRWDKLAGELRREYTLEEALDEDPPPADARNTAPDSDG